MLTLLFASYISCAPAKDSAEPLVDRGWVHAHEEYEGGAFMAIWEAAPGELWVVGGQEAEGFVLVGEKDSWVPLTLPAETPLLNWVHGTSARDVWVGGLSGTILHWDGSSWSDYSVEMEEAIWGIHAKGVDSVIAVGGTSRWGGERGKILALQDGGFAEVPLPEQLSAVSNLFKVSYLNDQYWAVGAGGALLYGDENGFSAVGTGMAADLITIVSSSSALHAVGGRGTGVYFPILDGEQQAAIQLPAGINGVDDTESGVLVVGERGYSAEIANGEIQEHTAVTFDVLHAALVDSKGERYAVGGNLFTADSFFHGTLLYWGTE